MIELDSTWNTIVMLLVAGGVGLIGGIGAAFIEWRRNLAAPAATTSGSSSMLGWLSCVVLGGIAAVAVLYFFPPTQEVVAVGEEGGPETTTFYDLTQLVALSLIVGSAGAAFLQTIQTRALALSNAERTKATEATATEGLSGVSGQAAKLAEAGVAAASTQLKAELQKPTAVEPQRVERMVQELAAAASDAVEEGLEPQVKTAQRMVAAAASGESTG